MNARNPQACLQTGQTDCHDESGRETPCFGSGQDAAFRAGAKWPEPRFEAADGVVLDRLTGLVWARDANLAGWPMFWDEALEYVAGMNRDRALGFSDWRLPNRRELRSLVSCQTRRPALPTGHPFMNVVESWCWTSTSAAIRPAHAWYVHMAGARMFYGAKDQSYLVWPVRGTGNGLLPATGQTSCFDRLGRQIACAGSGQDGETRTGRAWPEKRFSVAEDVVIDHLTGLGWRRDASLTAAPVSWREALAAVAELNGSGDDAGPWRLPNINELESLVDCENAAPALPGGHPFLNVRDSYWSSTTSAFEPDWAWALYLEKGAVGVGGKGGRHFFAWAVSNRRRP